MDTIASLTVTQFVGITFGITLAACLVATFTNHVITSMFDIASVLGKRKKDT